MQSTVAAPRTKLNILLVDDHPENLVALEGILHDLGHSLVRAESGADALKRLLDDEFALILLDVQMPGMDGYETASLIRERERLRTVPIIFLSAICKTPEHVSRGYATGAVDYITKPLDPVALRTKVSAFMSLAEEAQSLKREAALQKDKLAAELHQRAVVLDREVNARAKAEEALRSREEEYRLLFEGNPQPMWFVDRETLRFLDVNDAAIRRYGYSHSEFLGMTLKDIRPPDEIPKLMETLGPYPARGFTEVGTFTHRTKEGSLLYADIARMPTTHEGRPAIFVMVNDVTHAVLSEEAHVRHERAMEELNARLKRAMAETHHRVRNNLQSIVGLCEILEADKGEHIPLQDFRKLKTHVRALAAVHNILTQEARKDAFDQRLSSRLFLNDLLTLLKETAGEREVDHRIDDCDITPKQAISLAVVANELFTNAVKHGSGKIRLGFIVQDHYALFRIADEGPGFPGGFDPESLSRVGLELVQTVVRWDLQGVVRFENCGRGSRVVVEMPLNLDPEPV